MEAEDVGGHSSRGGIEVAQPRRKNEAGTPSGTLSHLEDGAVPSIGMDHSSVGELVPFHQAVHLSVTCIKEVDLPCSVSSTPISHFPPDLDHFIAQNTDYLTLPHALPALEKLLRIAPSRCQRCRPEPKGCICDEVDTGTCAGSAILWAENAKSRHEGRIRPQRQRIRSERVRGHDPAAPRLQEPAWPAALAGPTIEGTDGDAGQNWRVTFMRGWMS